MVLQVCTDDPEASAQCTTVYDTVTDDVCTTVNTETCNDVTETVCQPTYGTQCNPVFSEVCRQVKRKNLCNKLLRSR